MTNIALNTVNNCSSFIGLNNLGQSAADLYNKEYKSSAKNFTEGLLRASLIAATVIVGRSLFDFYQNNPA